MIVNWLNNRKVRRKLVSLKKKYVPLIREAEKAENLQQQAELAAQWAVEHESLLDPIYARNSAALISKALKYGIQVPRQEQGSKHYRRSGITGEFILRQLAQRRLRREVRNEERARNDEIRKWATATFALLGFVLALVSLLAKAKQPDPCPRNYYRSDAGACVFALGSEKPSADSHNGKIASRKESK